MAREMASGGNSVVRIDGGNGNRLTSAEVRRALFRNTGGFFLLFGTTFGGIPLMIATVVTVITAREARLERHGEAATARVVAKRISSESDSTSYNVFYEFVAADGRTYGDNISVSRREYYSLDEGDLIQVRYSVKNPLRTVVVGHRSVPLVWVLPFLSLFVVVGGALFVAGARKVRRRLKVYGSGLTAWGKNLGVREDPTMKVNNRPCRLLEFEYVDFTGRTHVGRSSYLSVETIARLEGLETVPVVYLAERPEDADLDLDRLS